MGFLNHQRYPSLDLLKVFGKKHKHMGVSKNRGTPKWMVYNGKPYWNGWFGGTPIFGNTHIIPNGGEFNGDESHGIPIRKKSPSKQIQVTFFNRLFVSHSMATLRYPGQKVKLLVGPTFVKSHDQLKGTKGIRRSPKMCQDSLGGVSIVHQHTPAKFNSSPLKMDHPNRKGSSSNHHFSGAMLNFQGVSFQFSTYPNRV